MKLEVMPIMEIREIICMARTTVKVAPRAPWEGPDCILVVGGGGEIWRWSLSGGEGEGGEEGCR